MEKYLKLKQQMKLATQKYLLKNKDIIREKRKLYLYFLEDIFV